MRLPSRRSALATVRLGAALHLLNIGHQCSSCCLGDPLMLRECSGVRGR